MQSGAPSGTPQVDTLVRSALSQPAWYFELSAKLVCFACPQSLHVLWLSNEKLLSQRSGPAFTAQKKQTQPNCAAGVLRNAFVASKFDFASFCA